MRRYVIPFVLAAAFFSVGSLYGQTPNAPHIPNNPVPQWVIDNAQKRAEIERGTNRDPNRNVTIVTPNRRRPAGSRLPTAYPATKEELEEMAAEKEAYEAKFGIDRNLRKKYESFLNKADTGMRRIFPDKNCGMGKVVTLAEIERCADVPTGLGGGSMFSFRCGPDYLFKLWTDSYQGSFRAVINSWSACETKLSTDIQFKANKFIAGDGIVQGIIADIGDVDLESIGLSHKAVEFMDDYNPKQSLSKIAKQNEDLAKGISADGFTFTNAAPLKINSTYVLRSVLYRYREAGATFMPRRGVDVRVAFKVVGQEQDGSVIIIWKELDRQYPGRKISDN